MVVPLVFIFLKHFTQNYRGLQGLQLKFYHFNVFASPLVGVNITDFVRMNRERSGYMGGILGIDVTSHRPPTLESKEETPVAKIGGKIQVLKREEIAI